MDLLPRLMNALTPKEAVTVADALPVDALAASLIRRVSGNETLFEDERTVAGFLSPDTLRAELISRGDNSHVLLGILATFGAEEEAPEGKETLTVEQHKGALHLAQITFKGVDRLRSVAAKHRFNAVRSATEQVKLSRRAVAKIMGLTSGRIQQILEEGDNEAKTLE
jgi:hypothetical protein